MNAEFQFKHEIPVQIRFSDVDQYGHMNNSVYFSLYDLAKTSYFRDVFGAEECNKFSVVVVNINADFLAPVFFSDELVIETTVIHLGHKSFTMLQRAFNKASGVLKCQCRTVLVGYDNDQRAYRNSSRLQASYLRLRRQDFKRTIATFTIKKSCR